MRIFAVLVGVLIIVGIGFRVFGGIDWTEAIIFGLLAAGLCWAALDAWREPIVGFLDFWRRRHDK